jgi:hypothetical protein
MTSLEQASDRVRRAAQAGDLEEVTLALEERSRLLLSGEEPTVTAWQLGAQAARFLEMLMQRLAAESSRLEQIRSGVVETMAPQPDSHIDYRG